ncbi:hypothetical protein ACFL3S_00255 [Gemmatimonadota bacterium]
MGRPNARGLRGIRGFDTSPGMLAPALEAGVVDAALPSGAA